MDQLLNDNAPSAAAKNVAVYPNASALNNPASINFNASAPMPVPSAVPASAALHLTASVTEDQDSFLYKSPPKEVRFSFLRVFFHLSFSYILSGWSSSPRQVGWLTPRDFTSRSETGANACPQHSRQGEHYLSPNPFECPGRGGEGSYSQT